MKEINVMLVFSLLVNVILIPFLSWQLVGYLYAYRAHVAMSSSLAYAIGYNHAKGKDLETSLDTLPTMIPITAIHPNSVEASLWPAKELVLQIDIKERDLCAVSVVKEK